MANWEGMVALGDRFWSKVQYSPGCWEWQASRDGDGYGYHSVGGQTKRAHRVSMASSAGEIPAMAFVLHSCDNPPCVNPAHLRIGSPKDNASDRGSRGRAALGAGHGMSKLTALEVLEVRRLYLSGGTSQAKLAKRFGVSQPSIGSIVRRETWAHIPESSVGRFPRTRYTTSGPYDVWVGPGPDPNNGKRLHATRFRNHLAAEADRLNRPRLAKTATVRWLVFLTSTDAGLCVLAQIQSELIGLRLGCSDESHGLVLSRLADGIPFRAIRDELVELLLEHRPLFWEGVA